MANLSFFKRSFKKYSEILYKNYQRKFCSMDLLMKIYSRECIKARVRKGRLLFSRALQILGKLFKGTAQRKSVRTWDLNGMLVLV
jgi:hypothetical protein